MDKETEKFIDKVALVALSALVEAISATNTLDDDIFYYRPNQIAERCYDIAEAMEKERKERGGE